MVDVRLDEDQISFIQKSFCKRDGRLMGMFDRKTEPPKPSLIMRELSERSSRGEPTFLSFADLVCGKEKMKYVKGE